MLLPPSLNSFWLIFFIVARISAIKSTAPWQTTEIKIHADHMIKTREKLNKLLSDRTGQPIDVINRDTERDHYMTAQEALEYGLIDGIMEKRV